MCGITGGLGPSFRNLEIRQQLLQTMSEKIRHRGPDDEGLWGEKSLGFAQRRLSILDLSPEGHQPMISVSGRYVLNYNGEVYNFAEIKKDVEQVNPQIRWRGHSDTEILAAAIEAWGWEETLKRSQGMFALAVWDRETQTLYLGRDRLGKKPLYWGRVGQDWVFASELKALFVLPQWSGNPDRAALVSYFRHGYIPAPLSAYEGIKKLPAGTWVALKESFAEFPPPQAYWSLNPEKIEPFKGSFDEACLELENLLDGAVKSRMVADVPLGAFLSGGIDSSLVTAFMAKNSSIPVKTFTVGFNEAQYDESAYAREVAKHLGTEHHEYKVSASDALDLSQKICSMFDEPFADSSQIPTFIVAQKTRQNVAVAVSGDGGDESFGGYSRYTELVKYADSWGKWPKQLLNLTSLTFKAAGLLNPAFAQRAVLLKDMSVKNREQAIYRYMMAHFKKPEEDLFPGTRLPDFPAEELPWKAENLHPVERAMWQDTLHYLCDDVMVKVDRTAMAVSLETRAPLLDYRIVEFAWSLPLNFKWTPQGGKRILKSILAKHIPQELIDRPKKGFSMPIGPWLKGPLKPWAEELLTPQKLQDSGFENEKLVKRLWKSFQSGQHDWSAYFWDLLVFQSWWQERTKR